MELVTTYAYYLRKIHGPDSDEASDGYEEVYESDGWEDLLDMCNDYHWELHFADTHHYTVKLEKCEGPNGGFYVESLFKEIEEKTITLRRAREELGQHRYQLAHDTRWLHRIQGKLEVLTPGHIVILKQTEVRVRKNQQLVMELSATILNLESFFKDLGLSIAS